MNVRLIANGSRKKHFQIHLDKCIYKILKNSYKLTV